MKITKLIREYVTEKVYAVYEPKIAALEEQEKQERTHLELARDRIAQIVEEAEAKAIACIETEFPAYVNRPMNYSRTNFHTMVCRSSSPEYYNPKLKNMRDALISERAHTIKSILTDLELGATRKELDEMIAKLLVEGV